MLNFTVPDGWKVIGNEKQEITINPGDSIILPLRVSVGGKVRGDIGYSVIASLTDSRGNTIRNEYCFVKIPRQADLKVKFIDKMGYIDQVTGMSNFSIRIENKGNREELVNFQFEADKSLGVGAAFQNQMAADVVLPPYTDTTIHYAVKLIEDPLGKNMFRLNMSASSMDTTVKANVWFRKLDPSFVNYIPEAKKPMVAEITMQGIMRGDNLPGYQAYLFGTILLKNRNDIYYYYRNFSSKNTESLYKYNRMYIGTHIDKWNFEIGDSYRSIESSLTGRGGVVGYKSPRIQGEIIANQNVRNKNNNIGTLIKHKITKTQTLHYGFVFNQNKKNGIDSKLALLGYNANIKKKHNLYLMGAYNHLSQSIDGVNQHNEFGGEVRYITKIDNFYASFKGKYGSQLYMGSYRGRSDLNLFSYYQLNPIHRLSLYAYENRYNVPTIRDESITLYRFSLSREGRVEHAITITPNIIMNWGPGYEQTQWKGVVSDTSRYHIGTQGVKGILGARFRIPGTQTTLTPQFTYSQVNVFKHDFNFPMDGSLSKRLNFNYQYFTMNLRSKIWGLMTTYTSGPKTVFDQLTYLLNNKSTRVIRVMPYIDAFIYKDMLQFMTNISYSNNLVSRTSFANITTQFFWYLPKDWRIHVLGVYTLQNRIDPQEISQKYQTIYLEAGIRKEFNFNQPRVRFHDLSLIFFKDFNGNFTQDPNEPGIKNVLTTISRIDRLTDQDIPGEFNSIELLSDNLGVIHLERIPEGKYSMAFNPVGKDAGTFSKALEDFTLDVNKSGPIYIPFVEKNKVFGKIVLNRSRLSGMGKVDVSNVRITATDSRGRTYSTLTNKAGEFVIFAPVTDEYIVNINNIFYENFDLRQNNYRVQFNGYKQFEVNFVFDEKVRRINFSPTGQDAQLAGIMQVRRTNLRGTIKDANTLTPIRARVNIINTKTNGVVTSIYSSSQTGDYNLSFLADENYLLEVLEDGYWYHSENLTLNQVTTFLNVTKDVLLKPIAIGSKIELNIRFDINRTDLAAESVAELNRLLRLLRDNQNIKVEIQGHSDDLEALTNQKISEERAKVVARYLIENGFSNLQIRGFGNTMPIAPNDTEANRSLNRRIEVEVISK